MWHVVTHKAHNSFLILTKINHSIAVWYVVQQKWGVDPRYAPGGLGCHVDLDNVKQKSTKIHEKPTFGNSQLY